jgi:ABC-2 type transport system ATP-binding protein
VRSLNAAGMTVIYTSHYMEEVQMLCKRIAILDNGRLLASDTLPNLLKRLDGRVRLTATGGDGFGERLSSLAGAKKVTPTERGFDVATDSIPVLLHAIMTLAAETGAAITAIEPREPTLERVFLHLTGRELRD